MCMQARLQSMALFDEISGAQKQNIEVQVPRCAKILVGALGKPAKERKVVKTLQNTV